MFKYDVAVCFYIHSALNDFSPQKLNFNMMHDLLRVIIPRYNISYLFFQITS